MTATEPKKPATNEQIKLMPQAEFLRYCMEQLGFLTHSGDFDMVRAAKFWAVRYELFCSMASGVTPLLRRERDKMKRQMDLQTGARAFRKSDSTTAAEKQNQRVGRYLRQLRERQFLVGIEGISKNQAQIAALLDVSVGAIQAWEYGRTRIPDVRMGQYLRVVGADVDQARIAWALLGAMPDEIQEALGAEDDRAGELWSQLVEHCLALRIPDAVEVTDKPAFLTHRQEQEWLKSQGAQPKELEQAAHAPKPRKE